MELHRKNRLIYDEADCIRQIANSVSGALKNISAYEKVYQVSIHDELTGLYNRSYCSEFIKNLDIKEHPTGMIYRIWITLSYTMICTARRPETRS